MINEFFKEKSPFCYNYFSILFEQIKENKRDFPQAIIFEGIDTKLQYLFSLELARILNCTSDENCTNCKWIKSFSHPAVNNVSQIHFKSEDDTAKTVISVKQAREIESNLKITSDYHRFFIFFSSKEYEYDDFELSDFEKLGYSTQINFSIEPLEISTFNPATLNALLKSVEEPPKNTTFVFLTKSRENILPTITSRCLVFKLSSNSAFQTNEKIKELASFYFNLSYQNAYEISEKIINFSIENQLDIKDTLNEINCYLKDLIQQNPSSYLKIINDIKIINQATKMIKSKVNEKNAIETMLFRLVRGY